MKNCRICNDLFKPKRSNQIICSNKCRKINREEYHKNYKATFEYRKGRRIYQKSQKNKTRLLKKYFNLSFEDYQKMVRQQSNKCAICGDKERIKRNGNKMELAIDHSHRTGKVRGLLCQRCNRGLGLFKEDILRLQNAIKYLKKS